MSQLENAIFEEILDNIDGYNESEADYWVENDAICEAGSVIGLIYYADTKKFFDDNEEEILELAQEYDFELSPAELGMTGYKNNMAWFAFEALKDSVWRSNKHRIDFDEVEAA